MSYSKQTWIDNNLSFPVSAARMSHIEDGIASAGGIGVDIWNSQTNPASVTDWGPIINSLITGGAKRLLFAFHDFPYSTQINLVNTVGIVFAGESGLAHVHPAKTRLIWKGATGSGAAFNLNGSDGFVAQDLAFAYDSLTYNGDLISLDTGTAEASRAYFLRCTISSLDMNTRSARSLVRGANMVDTTFDGCTFVGAQAHIRGFETYPAAHPDNNNFLRCTFISATNGYFANVGRNWVIDGCTFEFGSLGAFATPSTIISDITCTSNFTFINNRLWDFAGGTKALDQNVNNAWFATIKSNFIDTHTLVNINLAGPGSIVIEDNNFSRSASNGGTALIDLGNPATALKDYVRIKGNSWTASSTPANVIANTVGHGLIEIGPNREATGFAAHADEIRSLGGHERAHWSSRYLASVALAAGQPAITVDGKFQDGFGYITFQTGGSASIVGKLATVTFGTAMEKGFGQGTPDATHQVVLVQITPYGISNDGVSIAATIAAGFGAQVTGAQQTTFDIYTANAIPTGTKVGIMYVTKQM